MRLLFFATFALVGLVGCASNVSPNTYAVGSVGQVNRTIAGKIISVREVNIAGTNNIGGAAGAAAGATVGSAAGGNNSRGNIVGAIGGAIIGGMIGAAAESSATKQMGVEYVVETENGNLMTIVQGVDLNFQVGQRVLVLYGSQSRVIADPRGLQ